MDIWRITLATLRRWYVFLPLLALTAGAVFVVGEGVRPEYEVTGTALITPGQTQSPVPNPYGGDQQASAAVAIVLGSPEMRGRVEAEGLVPSYEVSGPSRSTIMNVRVRGPEAEQTVATGHYVLELAAQELAERQSAAGMPPSSQYGLDVLATPSVVGVAYDGKMQVQAVTGLVGASLALVVTLLLDDIVGLWRRRRARRRATAAEGADPGLETGQDWQPDEEPAPAERRRQRDHVHA